MSRLLLIIFCITSLIWGQKIISLGPAVTNQLLLLGVGDSIIGKTDYCPKEAGIKGKVISVGTLLTQNMEAIVLLQPDIIFASGLTPEATKANLKRLGFKLIFVDDPASFEMLCQNFITIAQAIGEKEKGEYLIAEAKNKLNTTIVTTQQPKRVFFELGSKPLFSVTANTLGNELIELSGGKNIFNLIGSGVVNREAVLSNDPEVIIISEMGEASKEEQERWLSFNSLTAAKRKAVYIVDGYAIGSPTPTSFVETVEEIKKLIAR